ncbi:hypothetical protein AB0G73_18915 [Streptomyces sp. NPDC020719]|uniref:hypothetical protein n=1 Tax=Streptomyces sp. NPDC020719 TaxID=3154896 RepID=UPI0033CB0C75
MSTAADTLGVLTATVHVLDPIERVPLVLHAGTEVLAPAIAEQITNPRCWQDGKQHMPKPARKTKSDDS